MTKDGELSDASTSKAALLLIGAFAVGQAVQTNNGNLHPAGLFGIALAIAAIAIAVFGDGHLFKRRISLSKLVAVFLAIQWSELFIWGLKDASLVGWYVIAMTISGIGAVLCFRSQQRAKLGIGLLVAGHFCAGAYVIHAMPQPMGDVWYFQQESTAALLRGENPYGVRYRNVYEPDRSFYGPGVVENGWLTYSYPYPPLMAMLTAAGRAFGDVRWATLAALELGAVLIALAIRGKGGMVAAAMLLFMPHAFRVIATGWSEPLVVLMLAGMLLCALRARKWLWLAVGLLLAIKQYTVLIVPLSVLLLGEQSTRRDATRMLVRAILVAIVITVPLAVWNFGAFFRSAVMLQIRQPFRIDALSFNAMLKVMTGIEIGPGAGFLLAGAVLVWGMARAPRTASGFAGTAALLLLVFFAFNKQAFANYYFVVFTITAFAGAMEISTSADAPALVQTKEELKAQRMAA